MLLLIFLPLVNGYDIYPCNSINNSNMCQELDYCSWCYNESYGYCNEYSICQQSLDLNCTNLYHKEACNLFNFIYFYFDLFCRDFSSNYYIFWL